MFKKTERLRMNRQRKIRKLIEDELDRPLEPAVLALNLMDESSARAAQLLQALEANGYVISKRKKGESDARANA